MTKLTKIHAMVKEISTICEIKMIREQIKTLSGRIKELTKPQLTDLSLIEKLYSHYTTFKKIPNERRAARLYNQQFSFVIIALYSPISFTGGGLIYGLRDRLASVIGFKAPTGVSNLCKDIVFQYDNFKAYRIAVDEIYTMLLAHYKELTSQESPIP